MYIEINEDGRIVYLGSSPFENCYKLETFDSSYSAGDIVEYKEEDGIVVITKVVEKFETEKVVPNLSEIEQLRKENEILGNKVNNLKEALFELSLYTLGS